MAEGRYLDFELLIAKIGTRYRAQVVESPSAGETATEFRLPFTRQRLENLLLRLGRPRVGVLGIDSPQLEAAREFGGKLFGAAFGGEVLACLRTSMERAEQDGAGLRIRLRLSGAPELVDLPWEFLYDPASGHFLALAAETPIVRYLDLPQAIKPLAVKPPLRVLAVISGPPEWEPVDTEREWAELQGAFGELERDGRAVLERLEPPTMDALQRRLWRGDVHVFHFVGHGGFRDTRGEGVLVFEDDKRGGRLVTAEELGTLLRTEKSLRLAMLNACEGARTDPKDPFGGTAQKLVQQGLPAVIAMQFPITMTAAARLARTFYGALGAGFPVDRALTEARISIRSAGNELEWATPVLFLRAEDGHLFDLEPAEPRRPLAERHSEASSEIRAPEHPAQPVPDGGPPLAVPAPIRARIRARAARLTIAATLCLALVGAYLWWPRPAPPPTPAPSTAPSTGPSVVAPAPATSVELPASGPAPASPPPAASPSATGAVAAPSSPVPAPHAMDGPVQYVFAADTGEDLSDTINAEATRYGIPPILLVAVGIQESLLGVKVERWGARAAEARAALQAGERDALQRIVDQVWPDISFGLYQEGALHHTSGRSPSLDEILSARERYLDPVQATSTAAKRLADQLAKGVNAREAVCLYNRPGSLDPNDPNCRRYQETVNHSARYLARGSRVRPQALADRSNYDSDPDHRAWASPAPGSTALRPGGSAASALAAVLTARGQPTNISRAVDILGRWRISSASGLNDRSLGEMAAAIEANGMGAERSDLGYDDLRRWLDEGTPVILGLPATRRSGSLPADEVAVAVWADDGKCVLITSTDPKQPHVRVARADLGLAGTDGQLPGLRLRP